MNSITKFFYFYIAKFYIRQLDLNRALQSNFKNYFYFNNSKDKKVECKLDCSCDSSSSLSSLLLNYNLQQRIFANFVTTSDLLVIGRLMTRAEQDSIQMFYKYRIKFLHSIPGFIFILVCRLCNRLLVYFYLNVLVTECNLGDQVLLLQRK